MNARRAPPYLLRCEVSHWMTAGRSNPSPVCGRVVICFPVISPEIAAQHKVETHLLAHGRRELLSAHVCKGDEIEEIDRMSRDRVSLTMWVQVRNDPQSSILLSFSSNCLDAWLAARRQTYKKNVSASQFILAHL